EEQAEHRPGGDAGRKAHRLEPRMARHVVEPARPEARESDCDGGLQHEEKEEDDDEIRHEEDDDEVRVFLDEVFPIAVCGEVAYRPEIGGGETEKAAEQLAPPIKEQAQDKENHDDADE